MTFPSQEESHGGYRLPHRRAFLIINCALLVLVVLIVFLAVSLYRKTETADRGVTRTNAILNNIRDLNIGTRTLEASARGYMIVHNPVLKRDFFTSLQLIDSAEGRIRLLLNQDPSGAALFHRLFTDIHNKVSICQDQVARVDRGDRHITLSQQSIGLSMSIQDGISALLRLYGDKLTELTLQDRKLNTQRLIVSLVSILPLIFFIALMLQKINRSIQERALVIQKAKIQEERHFNLIERSGVALAIVDKEQLFSFSSRGFEELTGYSKEELRGSSASNIIPFVLTNSRMNGIHQTDVWKDKTIDFKLTKRDGTVRWVSGKVFPIAGQNEQETEWQCVLWDIDSEKRIKLELEAKEAESKEQQKLLQDIIDNMPLVVFIKDKQGRYRIVNNKMIEVLGEPSAHILGKSDGSLQIPADRRKLYEETDRQVLMEKKTVVAEDILLVNGHKRYFWVTKLPLLDENGSVMAICGIANDISNFKEVEQDLRKARDEAENSRLAQEYFLANISHEIRTPMNGIIGMTDLLVTTELDKDQREFAESIQESALNLLNLINDLLDISKINSGKFKLESTTFDLPEAVRKAVYPLQFKADEKQISLEVIVEPSLATTVVGDPLRLQQIIINLASNAVKFTEQGGVTVRVASVADGDTDIIVQIQVSDTGIGIPEDRIADIFDTYTQSDFNIARQYGGTGLGLAIVKQLVEMQRGAISVQSRVGEGSTFTVSIPYAIGKEVRHERLTQPAEGRNIDLTNLRVLVAEDNTINQKVVTYMLQNVGATVHIANNGREALEAMLHNHFDIILMDMQMPEMDGYEATLTIRNRLQMNIPIIAMTANALKGEAEKCFEVGVNRFISKPFNQQELIQEIATLTNRYCTMTDQEQQGSIASPEPESILDLGYVRELAGGKKDYVAQVLAIFMDNTPSGLRDLAQLVDVGQDMDKISRQAHFLKSSVSIVRIKGMQETLQRIESLAKDERNLPEIRNLLVDLTKTFAIAEQLINKELNRPA